MQSLKNLLKKGDTIIEVTFAISVFSLVSIISMQVMDRNLATIQSALEVEMARNEIDAQAEALRFIQNAYLSERELVKCKSGSTEKCREYQDLWLLLSRNSTSVSGTSAGDGLANDPSKISQYISTACSVYYDTSNNLDAVHNIFADNAFVINTRNLDPTPANIKYTVIQTSGTNNQSDKFKEASLYPRILFSKGTIVGSSEEHPMREPFIYDDVALAEGIWVIAARDMTKGASATPEFYDFHIRTCWFAPGHERPTIVGTTIRLYNPEMVEEQK